MIFLKNQKKQKMQMIDILTEYIHTIADDLDITNTSPVSIIVKFGSCRKCEIIFDTAFLEIFPVNRLYTRQDRIEYNDPDLLDRMKLAIIKYLFK